METLSGEACSGGAGLQDDLYSNHARAADPDALDSISCTRTDNSIHVDCRGGIELRSDVEDATESNDQKRLGMSNTCDEYIEQISIPGCKCRDEKLEELSSKIEKVIRSSNVDEKLLKLSKKLDDHETKFEEIMRIIKSKHNKNVKNP